jgi:hypothetical protein
VYLRLLVKVNDQFTHFPLIINQLASDNRLIRLDNDRIMHMLLNILLKKISEQVLLPNLTTVNKNSNGMNILFCVLALSLAIQKNTSEVQQDCLA